MTVAEEQLKNRIYDKTGTEVEPLLVKRLKERLCILDLLFVLEVIERTCMDCWDGDNSCYCMRDE